MKGEEVGDGRAEGLSAKGGGGQAAISLITDIDGTHVRIFESSYLEGHVSGIYCTCSPRQVSGSFCGFSPRSQEYPEPAQLDSMVV